MRHAYQKQGSLGRSAHSCKRLSVAYLLDQVLPKVCNPVPLLGGDQEDALEGAHLAQVLSDLQELHATLCFSSSQRDDLSLCDVASS